MVRRHRTNKFIGSVTSEISEILKAIGILFAFFLVNYLWNMGVPLGFGRSVYGTLVNMRVVFFKAMQKTNEGTQSK